MKTHIESLNEYLNNHGFTASIWQSRRVYLNGFNGRRYDRDIKAYIDIDEPLGVNTLLSAKEGQIMNFSNQYNAKEFI